MLVSAPLQVALAGFGIFLLFMLVVGLILTAVQLYMAYWTYKDAQRRRMDNPEIWAIVVLFTTIVGFVLYLLVRE